MYNKIIRVITIVPIMAFAMLTIMYCLRPVLFGSIMQYVFAVLFLTVLPMLAYPLQPVIPKYKNAGREGQRNLAIVMAVIGYVLGIVVAICTDATKAVWIIYLTYLFSGMGIVIFNKLIKFRASGHACGIAGPITILVYFIGPSGFWGLPVFILSLFSSLAMKRHTIVQFLLGSGIAVLAFFISVLLADATILTA
ncbi:MAG: hypothetical protein PHQ49_02250 [Clostridia bacterium]|nr:hypothetical protein [Clostridia bacterium]